MMKRLMAVVAVSVAVLAVAGPVLAQDSFGARLRGFEEVPSVSSTGQGFFFAQLDAFETTLTYSLIYAGLESGATQAHIHIAQRGVNGGIVLFLCTNLAPPAGVPLPPACPAGTGVPPGGFQSVAGTLTAANVITQTGQGISAGEFAEVIHAIKAGVAYANVHTTGFPGGEIRGQITH
jgi:hypothetical protein